MPNSDEALAQAAAGGDREALATLYRRHCEPDYRYALAHTGTRQVDSLRDYAMGVELADGKLPTGLLTLAVSGAGVEVTGPWQFTWRLPPTPHP